MATYKKERNLWEARRRLPGGLRKSFYAQTESAAEALADAATGHGWNSSKTPTLEQFALLVYAPTLIQHSQKWRQQVAWALDKHIIPRFGKLPLASVDRHALQSFLSLKLSELSRSSVGHLRKVLHAVFALAEVDDLIPKNPIRAVRLPPVRVQPIEPPGIPELRLIIEAAHGSAVYRAVYLAATLGLRRGELMACRIAKDAVHVEHQLDESGNNAPLKTLSSRRVLPVSAHWVRALEGAPEVSRATLTRYLPLVLPAGVTLHTLRHAFATGIESIGCPRAVTAALLGHRPRSVTDIYVRVTSETMREWLQKWHDCLLSDGRTVGVQNSQ